MINHGGILKMKSENNVAWHLEIIKYFITKENELVFDQTGSPFVGGFYAMTIS